MNTISNQIRVCPPSRQLVWSAVGTTAMKVPVTFDNTAAIRKTEVFIQHAVARRLPANHPVKVEANESKRTNTTNERTSL